MAIAVLMMPRNRFLSIQRVFLFFAPQCEDSVVDLAYALYLRFLIFFFLKPRTLL
jgi:hypothetical protein